MTKTLEIQTGEQSNRKDTKQESQNTAKFNFKSKSWNKHLKKSKFTKDKICYKKYLRDHCQCQSTEYWVDDILAMELNPKL